MAVNTILRQLTTAAACAITTKDRTTAAMTPSVSHEATPAHFKDQPCSTT
jgi:hypothetical protein